MISVLWGLLAFVAAILLFTTSPRVALSAWLTAWMLAPMFGLFIVLLIIFD